MFIKLCQDIITRLGLAVMLTGCCLFVQGQAKLDSTVAINEKLADKYLAAIDGKSEKIAEQIDKKTAKYLDKLEKQEARLAQKLGKIDSSAAKRIFDGAGQQYASMKNKLKNRSQQISSRTGKYLPWLDSASTSLNFLDKSPLMANVKGCSAKIKAAMGNMRELQQQLKQAGSVKDFIKERRQYLKDQLQRYNFSGELKKYNQTAYYYSQQISEYKQALNDPEKAERKVLDLLNRVPVFQEFMRKNSMLVSLFAPPAVGEPDAMLQNVAGLQTRTAVQNMIQGQLSAGGPNAQAVFQQNIQEAQGYLSGLRNKMQQLGSSHDPEMEMPDFKPNEQKTKSFLQRLEYGTNIQSVKSNYFLPTTSDIALTVGYKLNEKNMIGVGASYKMGWGKDLKHIEISSEGLGLRSFIDMKLKGSFYASGGFEYNYQQPIASIDQIRYLSAWQQSGLLGISKIVSLKTKYFKKTKVQLLWDLLSYQQVPKTQALKFRIGYSF